MKRVLIGATVSAVLVYVACKLHQQGKLDGIYDGVNKFAFKAKRNLKNVADAGKNQAEYIKDRVEYEFQNGKE